MKKLIFAITILVASAFNANAQVRIPNDGSIEITRKLGEFFVSSNFENPAFTFLKEEAPKESKPVKFRTIKAGGDPWLVAGDSRNNLNNSSIPNYTYEVRRESPIGAEKTILSVRLIITKNNEVVSSNEVIKVSTTLKQKSI